MVIHTIKGFGIVNKAEIDVFLELSYFFNDPADVGNLIPGSSAFSKPSLNIWKFMVHVLLKSNLENFEHYFTSVWDECNCAVVWAFFGIAFLIILSKVNKKEDKYHMISHQIANICWIIEKAREFQKIYFCFIDYAKAFDCVDHNKLLKILKEMGIPVS